MNSDEVTTLLVESSKHVVPCPAGDPSTSGWATSTTRRDARTCIQTVYHGLVTIDPEGLTDFDRAVDILANEPEIRDAWHIEELGSVVASAVSAAAFQEDARSSIESSLVVLRQSVGSLVLFPVANVTWGKPSMSLGDLEGDLIALGDLNESFVGRISGEADRYFQGPIARKWFLDLAERYGETLTPVVFASRNRYKGSKSVDESLSRFSSLIDLSALFMRFAEPTFCRICASANRPGLRGVAIDRRAMVERLGGAASSELNAPVLSMSLPRLLDVPHRNDAEPFPLGNILHDSNIGQRVANHLFGEGPSNERIRLAARWFAQAIWSRDRRDAALALGISLEALIGSLSPLPGAMLAQRYSLLEPDAALRPSRAKEFKALWRVRSKLAHGARNCVFEVETVEAMEQCTFWLAQRIEAVSTVFAPKSEEELEAIFSDLASGAASWPL